MGTIMNQFVFNLLDNIPFSKVLPIVLEAPPTMFKSASGNTF